MNAMNNAPVKQVLNMNEKSDDFFKEFNNDANNVYRNNGNLSYMSTRPDINDNSQEIIINNLNEGNKNNNFYFLSQNVINKFEKEFEEKEVQTVIK